MKYSVKFKPVIVLVLSTAIFVTIGRFCHKQTHGFSLSKVQTDLAQFPNNLSSTAEGLALVKELLQRPFRYLGRGLQSFVFISEDGAYVLKLFNNRYQRKISQYTFFSHLPFLKKWTQEYAAYYHNQQDKVLKSYEIAYQEMRAQTGLIYVHLGLSQDLPATLTIFDPLNIKHSLNPNHIGFIIQKKAELVYPTFTRLVAHQDMSGAKRAISSLLDLIVWKFQHGIRDNDPLIRTNFGFIDQSAVQIDVGPLSKDPSIVDPYLMSKEIMRITASLKSWLDDNNCPELINHLDQELQKRLSF